MEELQPENSEKSTVPKNLQPHVYKKGQSGNPAGRPKGSVSLKQYAKTMLEKMTPDEREEYMQGLPKEFIWKMAEGNPQTTTDITTKGESINTEQKVASQTAINEYLTDNTERESDG